MEEETKGTTEILCSLCRDDSTVHSMAARLSDPEHSIIIADRGYEGWRSFLSLINSGTGFIIRMKSPSSNGILSAYDFSKEQSYVKADGSFDVNISTILTHKQTNEVKENPNKYTYVLNINDIPELKDPNSPYCPISFRVVNDRLHGSRGLSRMTCMTGQLGDVDHQI